MQLALISFAILVVLATWIAILVVALTMWVAVLLIVLVVWVVVLLIVGVRQVGGRLALAIGAGLCALAVVLMSIGGMGITFNDANWLSAQEAVNLALLAAGLAAFVTLLYKLRGRTSDSRSAGRVDWIGWLFVLSALCLTAFAMLTPWLNDIRTHPDGQYWWLNSLIQNVALFALLAGTCSLAYGVLLGIYEILSQTISDGARQENPTDLGDKKELRKGSRETLLVYAFLVCLLLVASSLLAKPIRIAADVSHYDASGESSGYFEIENHDPYDWTDVHLTLNRYYTYTFASIPAGKACRISDDDFAKSDGTRFDSSSIKPLTFLIQCQVSKRYGISDRVF